MRMNRSVKVLSVPADLHFVATTGLLLTHWRPFIQRLIGHYKRQWVPRDNGLALGGLALDHSDSE